MDWTWNLEILQGFTTLEWASSPGLWTPKPPSPDRILPPLPVHGPGCGSTHTSSTEPLARASPVKPPRLLDSGQRRVCEFSCSRQREPVSHDATKKAFILPWGLSLKRYQDGPTEVISPWRQRAWTGVARHRSLESQEEASAEDGIGNKPKWHRVSPRPSLPLNVGYYTPMNFLFSLNQLEDKFGSWLFGAFFRSHSIEKYLNAFRCKHFKNISLFLLTDILKGLSALGQLSSKTHKTFAAYRICCCLPMQRSISLITITIATT